MVPRAIPSSIIIIIKEDLHVYDVDPYLLSSLYHLPTSGLSDYSSYQGVASPLRKDHSIHLEYFEQE